MQKRATRNGDVWEGFISTLTYNFRFRLVPAPSSKNPNAPKYQAVTRNSADVDVVIGAAWVKTMKRSERAGEEFFTLTFSDPSFPKPLNAAAFLEPGSSDYVIDYKNRQDKAA